MEMAKVLKQTLPRPAIEAANKQVIETLNGYTRGAKAKISVAHALMLTNFGHLVSAEYSALLENKYGADVFRKAELADINNWVKRKTEGKIDRILDEIDWNSIAVVLNAIYFKASWAQGFDNSATRDAEFWLTRSEKIRVPTMQATGEFAVVHHLGYRAIRLPYRAESISMIVVVPEKIDGVREIGKQLAEGGLAKLLDFRAAAHTMWALSFPRFKTAVKADLLPLFKAAGMRLAFDDIRADFSGMTGGRLLPQRFKIGHITHRALIEVDEEGTVAAAAISWGSGPVSAPLPPKPFVVDRPFLFYLVDNATGAILFQGRIIDPR